MALAVEILGADLLLLAFGDWNSELLEDGRVAEGSGRGACSTSSGRTIRSGPEGEPIEGSAGEGLGLTRGGGRGGGLGGFGGAGDKAADEDITNVN
jgi:hypothetical protein